MKEEIRRHAMVLGVYLVVITLLRWSWNIELAVMWLAGVVGYGLVAVDRLVYVYWLHPEEQLSQQVRSLVAEKRYREMVELIYQRRKEQTKLSFRSLLFLVVWVPLAFFALTSTGSLFASGLVMGIGLHLVQGMWREQRSNPVGLNRKLFWQVKREVSGKEQELVVYGFSLVFGLLTLMLI
jgi:hypothetical protein